MQAIFDNEALNKLPLIKLALKTADNFEANQMRVYTLREIYNSKIPLNQMSEDQKQNFSKLLLETFKTKNWI